MAQPTGEFECTTRADAFGSVANTASRAWRATAMDHVRGAPPCLCATFYRRTPGHDTLCVLTLAIGGGWHLDISMILNTAVPSRRFGRWSGTVASAYRWRVPPSSNAAAAAQIVAYSDRELGFLEGAVQEVATAPSSSKAPTGPWELGLGQVPSGASAAFRADPRETTRGGPLPFWGVIAGVNAAGTPQQPGGAAGTDGWRLQAYLAGQWQDTAVTFTGNSNTIRKVALTEAVYGEAFRLNRIGAPPNSPRLYVVQPSAYTVLA